MNRAPTPPVERRPVGPGPSGCRWRRRGGAGLVGRADHGRCRRPASGPAGLSGAGLEDAARAGARAVVRSTGLVVHGLGGGVRLPDGVRRPRYGRGPAVGGPSGSSMGSASRRTRCSWTATGTSWVWAARSESSKATPPACRSPPRRSWPRSPAIGSCEAEARALPRLRVRFQQGLSVPPAQDGPAGVRPFGHPPPNLDLHGAPGLGRGRRPGRAPALAAGRRARRPPYPFPLNPRSRPGRPPIPSAVRRPRRPRPASIRATRPGRDRLSAVPATRAGRVDPLPAIAGVGGHPQT